MHVYRYAERGEEIRERQRRGKKERQKMKE